MNKIDVETYIDDAILANPERLCKICGMVVDKHTPHQWPLCLIISAHMINMLHDVFEELGAKVVHMAELNLAEHKQISKQKKSGLQRILQWIRR